MCGPMPVTHYHTAPTSVAQVTRATDTLSAFYALGTLVTQLGITSVAEDDHTMQQMTAELDAGHVIWPAFQAIAQKP